MKVVKLLMSMKRMTWKPIFMLIWNHKHHVIWAQLQSCDFLKLSRSNGPSSAISCTKRRLHIPEAQSSVRSSNPLPSVSYGSEVPGNALRPTNAAPAGLQQSISQGRRPTHMHESEVQGNVPASRFGIPTSAGFQSSTSQLSEPEHE